MLNSTVVNAGNTCGCFDSSTFLDKVNSHSYVVSYPKRVCLVINSSGIEIPLGEVCSHFSNNIPFLISTDTLKFGYLSNIV